MLTAGPQPGRRNGRYRSGNSCTYGEAAGKPRTWGRSPMAYLYALLLGLALAVMARTGLPGLVLVAAVIAWIIFRTMRRRDQDLSPKSDTERWIFGTYANWALYNCEYIPDNNLMPNYDSTPIRFSESVFPPDRSAGSSPTG